jgi:hypothetical protein
MPRKAKSLRNVESQIVAKNVDTIHMEENNNSSFIHFKIII